MLLTALPPAPPTPHTMMRGFNSLSWGVLRLIGIPCLSRWASADAPSTAETVAVRKSLFSSAPTRCNSGSLTPVASRWVSVQLRPRAPSAHSSSQS